jgi:hypothetical protein
MEYGWANKKFVSVNESTNPLVASPMSMAELGNVLPQLIFVMATALLKLKPLLFSKLNIKDKYWRGVVPEDEE